jgi:hypothetical protein
MHLSIWHAHVILATGALMMYSRALVHLGICHSICPSPGTQYEATLPQVLPAKHRAVAIPLYPKEQSPETKASQQAKMQQHINFESTSTRSGQAQDQLPQCHTSRHHTSSHSGNSSSGHRSSTTNLYMCRPQRLQYRRATEHTALQEGCHCT